MKVPIHSNIEAWMTSMIAAHRDRFRERPLFIDVGGYHGEFASMLLETGVLTGGTVFEPNPDNLAVIRERFGADTAVEVVGAACGDREGSARMFCSGPAYTGSVLPYANPGDEPVNEFEVPIKRLDDHLAESDLGRVGFIKIDTQGHDLQVLRGATGILEQSRPWLLTEMIYTDLYENQCHPHEIASLLAGQGYVKAAEFNEYYSENGWLAWSDACFVPRDETLHENPGYDKRPTFAELSRKVRRKPVRSMIKILTGRL